MHKPVPFDHAAAGTQQLQAILWQSSADREHMTVLKAAIGKIHEVQQSHAVKTSPVLVVETSKYSSTGASPGTWQPSRARVVENMRTLGALVLRAVYMAA